MKKMSIVLLFILGIVLLGLLIKIQARPVRTARDKGPLRLVQTITLPGVKGRIDHMAVDIGEQRLFVAALGNNTMEVVDLHGGKRLRSIKGLHEPQDVYYVPEFGRIFVSNGADGSLCFFDIGSLRLIGNVDFREDADNLRYDPRSKYLYVGYGNGALGIMEARSAKIMGNVVLAGHPEAFQLERKGTKVFINIPSARQLSVVDRAKKSVIAVWHLRASGNFAMALDEKRGRLFIGCRHPAKMLIYNTESGKEVSSIDIGGDVDDIFYDDLNRQLYVACGEGTVDVIRQIDPDKYELATKIRTAPGARTARFVPEWMRFYLAVPGVSGRMAEIRVYAVKNL